MTIKRYLKECRILAFNTLNVNYPNFFRNAVGKSLEFFIKLVYLDFHLNFFKLKQRIDHLPIIIDIANFSNYN